MAEDAPAVAARGPRLPRLRRTLPIALGAAVLAATSAYGVVTLPLVLWAQATEPDKGVQRPFVKAGLEAAPWVAVAAFVVTAAVVARWRWTGRRLPTPERS